MFGVHICVLMCWHSLVTLRSLPAAQSESAQQLVPAQENKHTQSKKRKNDEEEDQQPVSERRVFIWGGQTNRFHINNLARTLPSSRGPSLWALAAINMYQELTHVDGFYDQLIKHKWLIFTWEVSWQLMLTKSDSIQSFICVLSWCGPTNMRS